MKKTLEQWAVEKGIEILDPDGFDRSDPNLYTKKMTEEEFEDCRRIEGGVILEWIISDTHFGHSNIIDYENRPFKNVEEMDRALINNWNSVVGKKDTVWHLGDFFLTYTERQFEIFDQLNGNIILIRGNHDKQSRAKLIERIGFAEVYDEYTHGDVLFTHRPKQPEEVKERRFLVNIHGHKHSVDKQLSQFHYCVSAENINYTPVKLEEIRDEYRSY